VTGHMLAAGCTMGLANRPPFSGPGPGLASSLRGEDPSHRALVDSWASTHIGVGPSLLASEPHQRGPPSRPMIPIRPGSI